MEFGERMRRQRHLKSLSKTEGFSLLEMLLGVSILGLILVASSHFIVDSVKSQQRQSRKQKNSKDVYRMKEYLSEKSLCTCLFKDVVNKDAIETKRVSFEELNFNNCNSNIDFKVKQGESIKEVYLTDFKEVDEESMFATLVVETKLAQGVGGAALGVPLIFDFSDDKMRQCETARAEMDNNTNVFLDEGGKFDIRNQGSVLWWDESRACLVEDRVFKQAFDMFRAYGFIEKKDEKKSLFELEDLPKNISVENGIYSFTNYDALLSPANQHLPRAIFGEFDEEKPYPHNKLRDYYWGYEKFRNRFSNNRQQDGRPSTYSLHLESTNTLYMLGHQRSVVDVESMNKLIGSAEEADGFDKIHMSIPGISISNYKNILARNGMADVNPDEMPEFHRLWEEELVISDLRSHWFIGAKVSEGSMLPIIIYPSIIYEEVPVEEGSQELEEVEKKIWLMKYAFCYNGSLNIMDQEWPREEDEDDK